MTTLTVQQEAEIAAIMNREPEPESLAEEASEDAEGEYTPVIDKFVDAAIVRFSTADTSKGFSLSIGFRPLDAPESVVAWANLPFNSHKIKKGDGKGSRWVGQPNSEKSLDTLDFLKIDLTQFDDVDEDGLSEAMEETYAGLDRKGNPVCPASVSLEWEEYEGEDVLKVQHIQASKGRAVKAKPLRAISKMQGARTKRS